MLQQYRYSQARGYTLVELMVVVALVAILAVVSLAYVGNHATAAQAKEGLASVQSIRAAQEHYRSLNGVYMNASSSGAGDAWFPRNPLSGEGTRQYSFLVTAGSHGDAAAWRQLNPTMSGAVRFGYLVNAGVAGAVMTAPQYVLPGLVWPTPTDSWYVIQAQSDLDNDGSPGYYAASSLTGRVYAQNAGE